MSYKGLVGGVQRHSKREEHWREEDMRKPGDGNWLQLLSVESRGAAALVRGPIISILRLYAYGWAS